VLTFIVWRVRGGSLAGTVALTVVGALPFAAIELAYNLARWGTPTEAGYAYLSGADNPVFPYGPFSPRYLPDHLYAIFLARQRSASHRSCCVPRAGA